MHYSLTKPHPHRKCAPTENSAIITIKFCLVLPPACNVAHVEAAGVRRERRARVPVMSKWMGIRSSRSSSGCTLWAAVLIKLFVVCRSISCSFCARSACRSSIRIAFTRCLTSHLWATLFDGASPDSRLECATFKCSFNLNACSSKMS